MNFGTSTRIIRDNQMATSGRMSMNALIVAAAQKAIKNNQYIIADGNFDLGSAVHSYGVSIAEAPCYVVLRGKGAGRRDSVLLYQSKKVLEEKSAYDYQVEFARAVDELVEGVDVELPIDSPITPTTTQITIDKSAILTMIYPFKKGSTLRIVNDGTDSSITGMDGSARLSVSGKNIVAMYYDADAEEIKYQSFADDGTGIYKAVDTIIESTYVALLEDQFNVDVDGVPHGTIYIDLLYNASTVADKMYYIDSLDSIRTAFGDDALEIGPSGAAYNAYQYYKANSGRQGFYVYAVAPASGIMYLSASEIGDALDKTIRYKDVYEVIPITHDPGMPAILDAHTVAMSDPEARQERRGYVGAYMPSGVTYYTYDEFEHICEIGKAGERDYLLGVTEEDGGTGRYGGRTQYVNQMMNRNGYTTNEKLTLLETKYGIIDGMYVTASTLLALYVAFRKTLNPGYVVADTTLPIVSSISFAGMFNDVNHLDVMQNYGIMSIYQDTPGSPVTIYYPCTAATDIISKREEYLVIGADMLARDIRSIYNKYIANGEDNKTSAGFVGEKAVAYNNKLKSASPMLNKKYVENYKLFDNITILPIMNSTIYEGGLIVPIKVVNRYAVNEIEMLIYI